MRRLGGLQARSSTDTPFAVVTISDAESLFRRDEI
jgi:hypothetical protein